MEKFANRDALLFSQLEGLILQLPNNGQKYTIPELFQKYKEEKDALGVASILIGIGKYIDFRYPKNEIDIKTVNEIANICLQYLSSSIFSCSLCVKLEDGAAVPGTCIRCKINFVPNLPVSAAVTYINISKTVDAEIQIYRIVSDESRSEGNFWFTHPDINSLTRKEWRSAYAILRMYNPGTEIPTPAEPYYL